MDFQDLVQHIRVQGCRVRIYKDRKQIHGNMGTFFVADKGPLISLALKGSPKKKRVEYLLHEFGHYLQWRDGYMKVLDSICDAYDVWDEWVNEKIELTSMERRAARNTMLAMEWDAEMRALELGKQLDVKHFDPEHHLMGANAYMTALKWAWANRKDFTTAPKRKKFRPRVLTEKQLFAPLTREEKEILRGYKGT